MVNTIFILDRTYNVVRILVGNKNAQKVFWDDTYTQEFDTGAETFEFSCYLDEAVVEGNFVVFRYNNQYKMFSIIDMEQQHSEGRLVANCYCEIASLTLLNSFVRPFSGDMNCIQFFQHILQGTDWVIGRYSSSLENNIQTVDVSNIQNVWSLIEDYKDIYECELNVRIDFENNHVTGQYIDIYSDGGLGNKTFKRFEYGRNVTGIIKKKDLYDWCTGIIIDSNCDVGDIIITKGDNLGFEKSAGDVILNDNANRMYNNGRTHVIGVYNGDETDPMTACVNAWKELKKRSEPRFDYEVTTALTPDEYEDLLLGDTVYVIDHSYTPPLLLEARVGELQLSFTDRTKNKCVLTNYKEIKSKLLDADYVKLTGTIQDVVNTFFPITSEGIADGAICDGKIDTVYYREITADIVSASIGAFENLYTQNLTVVNADIQDLMARTANITILESQLAEIDTLVNGHLTSDNIQSMVITGDKFTVANGFIKDAMIDSISAGTITSGTLNTGGVKIESVDGGLIIKDNLQQFKDENGNIRIQMGKDAQGNFTFMILGEDGQGILMDENGITENAIGDGLIVNDMVAEDAGISGSKLDIDSVVSEINEGSTTIKGTKVKLDETGQSLEVAFNELNTKVDNIEVGEFVVPSENLLLGTEESTWMVGNSSSSTYTLYDTTENRDESWNNAQMVLSCTYIIEDYEGGSFRLQGAGVTDFASTVIPSGNGTFKYEQIMRPSTDQVVTSSRFMNCTGIRLQMNSFTGDVTIKEMKLERGSVATPWSGSFNAIYEKINSNATNIKVQQGEIETLISNTTIVKSDGQTVLLKDEYNSTKDTVNSHTTKIGSMETTIDRVTSQQTILEQDLDGFKTTVSESYITKEDLENGSEGFATKSELQQTADAWTATFKNGYNEGIVTLNANGLTVQQGTGKVELNKDALRFYDGTEAWGEIWDGQFSFTSKGSRVGSVGSTVHAIDTGRPTSVLGCEYDCDVAVGYKVSQNNVSYRTPLVVASTDYNVGDYANGSEVYYRGANIAAPFIHGQMTFRSREQDRLSVRPIDSETNEYFGWGDITCQDVHNSYYSWNDKRLTVMGGTMLGLGVRERPNSSNAYEPHELLTMRYNYEDSEYEMDVSCRMMMNRKKMYEPYIVEGTFEDCYTVSSLATTSNYAARLVKSSIEEGRIYSNMSFDKDEIRWCWKHSEFTYAETDIDENDNWIPTGRNICYIELPGVIAENIEPDYHINISKMSWGDYRIAEKTPYYFILESQEEDFEFTFEVVGKLIKDDIQ